MASPDANLALVSDIDDTLKKLHLHKRTIKAGNKHDSFSAKSSTAPEDNQKSACAPSQGNVVTLSKSTGQLHSASSRSNSQSSDSSSIRSRVSSRRSESRASSIITTPDLEAPPGLFPCEFPGCEMEFQDSEEEAWIEHVCAHIPARVKQTAGFPSTTICWFCNQKFERTVSNMDCNFEQLFKQRLAHIAMHIRDEPGRIRPDWWFFKYLETNGLVPHDVADRIKEFHEIPQPKDMILGKATPKSSTAVLIEVERSSRRPGRRSIARAEVTTGARMK